MTLLGRGRELAELDAAWNDAVAGHGGLVLVAGEPGIGKTRLVEAAAQRAESAGARVVWGRCWESGGAPAYWPWPEVVRELVADVGRMAVERELGEGAELLARLEPALHGQGLSPDDAGDEDERFALFDAVARLLRQAAGAQPQMLVLEDVHAADLPSLQLLQYVARAATSPVPVLILATSRSWAGADLFQERPLLTALLEAGRRMQLTGLEPDDIALLVAERVGIEPPRGVADEIHAATEGNPFFSGEIAGLLAAEGALAPGAAPAGLPLPAGVSEVITKRLEGVSAEVRAMLEVAAVVGREFRVATVEQAAEMERVAVLEALDAASAASLVIGGGRPGRFRFGHGLIREVIYDSIAPVRRMRIHGAIAAALERSGQGTVDELAHHSLEAAPAGDAHAAVDYAERAAGAAMRLHAYDQAAGYLERALAALELVERPPEDRRVLFTLLLGEAKLRAGGAARETLLGVVEAARELGDAELLGRTAVALAWLGLSPGMVDSPLLALLEEALELLGEEDSSLRARLMGRLAAALYYAGEEERRNALARESVEIARRIGDPGTLADVMTEAHLSRWGPDTTEEGIAWAQELLELGAAAGDDEHGLAARTWRVDLLLEIADISAADQALEDFADTANRLRQPRVLWRVPGLTARRAAMEGRFDEAERLNAEAMAMADRYGDQMAPLLLRAQALLHRYLKGSLADLEPMLRQAATTYRAMPVWRCAVALANAQAGRVPQAQAELDALAHDGLTTLPRDNVWILAMALLADTCREVSDGARAAEVEELLAPYAGRLVVSPQAAVLGPVERYLGLCAAARGDVDAARAHFATARDRAERIGARPLMAHVAFDEARLTGDRGLAASALALAEELGMDLLADRVSAFAGPVARDVAPASSGPVNGDGTGRLVREGDIWALSLDGRTVRLKDGKGLRHLALLLANPGVELHAVDIVGGLDGAASADPDLEVRAAGDDDAGPLLDSTAKAAYREHLESLRADIEEAEAFGDHERASRAREEMEFVAHELTSAVGLGGRDRKAISTAERARVNVTRAVRSTLKRIADHDEHLGQELETTVHTGTFCSYQPDPRRPVRWEVLDG